ncbi:hypothetical protein GCM10023340_12560 [Nocardioides marinquilinus]|uniref:Uncharacterized protein n=1 Tax=Nocardioides marinquilinus TaxID=1210400 RepID=A0ABP9PE17_9ACTN
MSTPTPARAQAESPPLRGLAGLAGLVATLVAALGVVALLLLAPLVLLAAPLVAYPLLRARDRRGARPAPAATPPVSPLPADRFGSGAW